MRMKKKFVMLLLILEGAIIYAYPQTSITYEANSINVTDTICLMEVEYTSAQSDGESVYWDFSCAEPVNQLKRISYLEDSLGILMEFTLERINKYVQTADSLQLVGYETPLVRIDYEVPVIYRLYPFDYGDQSEKVFHGRGTYCKQKSILSDGVINIEADGTGTLCLEEQDTIQNVTRLHVIRTSSISMMNASDSIDSLVSDSRQEIEERYIWYARGCRYPVFETISQTYYADAVQVSCIQKAYKFLPKIQNLLHDSINAEIQLNDSIMEVRQHPIFQYMVSVLSNAVHIDYNLTESASITALVCDVMGMVYERKSTSHPAGENYSMDIDCSELDKGTYILYLNVNGKVFSETLHLNN